MAVKHAAVEGAPNSDGGGELIGGIYNVLVNGKPIATLFCGSKEDDECEHGYEPGPPPPGTDEHDCPPIPSEASKTVFAGFYTTSQYAGPVHREGDKRVCGAITLSGGGTNPTDMPVFVG